MEELGLYLTWLEPSVCLFLYFFFFEDQLQCSDYDHTWEGRAMVQNKTFL